MASHVIFTPFASPYSEFLQQHLLVRQYWERAQTLGCVSKFNRTDLVEKKRPASVTLTFMSFLAEVTWKK